MSFGEPGFTYESFMHRMIVGDTVINGIAYFNVYSESYSITNGVGSYSPPNKLMALREDTNHIFYAITYNNPDTTFESEWCRFNYQLGDTMFDGTTASNYVVEDIDTVAFGSETRLFFKSMYPFAIMEGMGLAYNGSFNAYLLCFEKDGALYSQAPFCQFDLGSNDIIPSKNIVIYPNPANDIIWVNTNSINGQITVSDMSGRELLTKTVYSSKTMLPILELQEGIYLLTYTNGLSQVFRLFSVIR